MTFFSSRIAAYAGKPSWTPNDLSTKPIIWLDASSTGNFTVSSGKISAWKDISGNNNNMNQATSTLQPTLNTSTNLLNGLPTVGFVGTSGSGNYLDATTPSAFSGANVALFCVAQPNAYNGSGTSYVYGRLLSGWPANPDDYNQASGILYTAGTSAYNKYDLYRNSAVQAGGAAFTTNTWNQLGFTRTGTAIRNYLNGATTTGTDSDSTAISVTHLRLGNNAAASDSAYNGNIAEWMLFSSAPSVSDSDKIVGYLAWKWGLQGLLANSHPYKYQAP